MVTRFAMYRFFLTLILLPSICARRVQTSPAEVEKAATQQYEMGQHPLRHLSTLLLARLGYPIAALRQSAAGVSAPGRRSRVSYATPVMNIFGDIFDEGKLTQQKPPERPLLPSLVKDAPATYTLQEKLFSFSGEDFRVKDIAGEEVMQVAGGNINLGGKVIDKLAFKDEAGVKHFSVERRILAASTCYDVYSADGKELIAKIEREWISMTPKYQFYYEGDLNPFGDFYAEGSFLDRQYTFKTGGGMETIAKVRRAPEVFNDVDGYAVDVAAGVDAAAIIAMAVVIDEDHDEEDAKKKRNGESEGEEEGGGWPFR